jgi:hypothetical protein
VVSKFAFQKCNLHRYHRVAAAAAAARRRARDQSFDVMFGAVNCAVLAELCLDERLVQDPEGYRVVAFAAGKTLVPSRSKPRVALVEGTRLESPQSSPGTPPGSPHARGSTVTGEVGLYKLNPEDP